MKKRIILTACLLVAACARAQVVPQTITLVKGWNAFHLHVTPDAIADDFFATWPVDHVSLYDSDSFLRTAQFVTDPAAEAVLESTYLVWHRGQPDISTFRNVLGDRVYVCNASSAYSVTVYGRPCVPRMAWHPASAGQGETSLNFFGVNLEPGALLNPVLYLNGLDTGYTVKQFVAGGNPSAMGLLPATLIKDGMVLVMDASRVSNWSGPLFLAPVTGIDFGNRSSLEMLNIRNDAATRRTVSITCTRSQGPVIDLEPPLLEMKYLTSSNTWENLPLALTKSLAPKETWSLVLAIDRTQFHGASDARRAAILTIRDQDGGSYFCARMPVAAVNSTGNSTGDQSLWPAGLWLAEIKMNRVTQFPTDTARMDGVPAGGPMKLRAIMHVDMDGNLKLLQRVLVAAAENEDGASVSLHLSEAFVPPGAAVTRLSTVDMGVDNPVVEADTTSVFRQTAAFHFNVAAQDRSSPFRHAYHPDHDGLQWDFTTPAPSGDNYANYVGTVKPETFSVSNVVSFAWSEKSAGVAPWDPRETLEGNCRWELHGLRRQGAIYVDGPFVMRRISTVGALTP